jgi:hypothetical protein
VGSNLDAYYVLLGLTAKRAYFSADWVIEDPAHLGFVYAFVDHNDPTHWLVQTIPALQVRMPAPHAHYGGRLACSFNGNAYTSTRADWRFLHDGTGVDVFFVGTPTATSPGASAMLATQNNGTTPGFSLLGTTNGSTWGLNVFKTGGTAYASGDRTGVVLGNPTYFNVTVLSGVSNVVLRQKSTISITGTLASPDSAINPAAFTLGRLPGGGTAVFVGTFRSLFLTPVLTSERGVAQECIRQDTGIFP